MQYELEIRPYWRGALDYIVDLDIKGYDNPIDPVDVARAFRDIRVCVLADPSEEIVGFTMVNVREEIGRIVRFTVKPKYRRKKIGSEMMLDLFEQTKHLKALTALVGEYDLASQMFLKRHGFLYKRQLELSAGGIGYLFVKENLK